MPDFAIRFHDELALIQPLSTMAKRVLIDSLVPHRINELWLGDTLPVADTQVERLVLHLEAEGLKVCYLN